MYEALKDPMYEAMKALALKDQKNKFMTKNLN